MKNKQTAHTGMFIREKVFPPGLTVTAAAEILNIGRVALSRVLNGKASLTPDLAERIETAFGFSAAKLLRMQASYQNEEAKHRNISVPVGLYVPPFLQITANQIESWASEHEAARSRLPVLLRILVNSTGSGLTKVDFPGNDDSQRKGWDGFVEADRARPWIPEGASGWEFGCSEDVKRKANSDFGKRTGTVSAEEREDITFVFATPRRWSAKDDWEKERRAEKRWKDVRVFDASDLEQWMEQSIPAQAWFAGETGISHEGVFSLEACWENWRADCEPELVLELFDQALGEYEQRVLKWLEEEPGRPLAISADSVEEGLAFLHAMFSGDESAFRENADKIVVLENPETVSKLGFPAANLIAVSMSPEVERELAPYRKSIKTVLVYPKNTLNIKPDIDLKPLNPFAFDSALEKMGCTRDEIDRYRRKSGFSLTVLRRRLSKLPAVQTPGWAGDEKHTRSLIAAMFAGTWDITSEKDKKLVSKLAGGGSYEEIERKILDLRSLDDSPVWSAGTHLGVKSKIDVLFAVSGSVTGPDIERFFEVAEEVIQEDDPALDLPDGERWMANIYGKSREISDMLRRSVIDSFLLLAVPGSGLFRDRGGFGIEVRVRKMVKKWFRPGDERSLESRKDALPAFAEAAPETFLSIIEEDLERAKPGILSLFRPVEAPALMSPSPPRVELLWALESLAWSDEYLVRTADILARLAREEVGDNWTNSSMKSLGGIFRSWMPQASAPVDGRISVFNRLLEKFPDVGWELCVEQFSAGPKTGEYNSKPRWRTHGHGHGEPVPLSENWKFILNALEKALGWPDHTEETLSDLVRNFESVQRFELEPELWRLIEDWRGGACEEAKARLRETIRVSGCLHSGREETVAPACRAYEMLTPSDVVLRYEWLFLHSSVPPARGEEYYASGLEEFGEYLSKSEKENEERRISALSEICAEEGVGGLTRLARGGEGQRVVGSLVLRVDSFDDRDAEKLVCAALDEAVGEYRHQMENLVRGVLEGLEAPRRENLLRKFLETNPGETFLRILLLAPFRRKTWEFLNEMSGEEKSRYWREVICSRHHGDPLELNEAMEELIRAERPHDAASLVGYGIRRLEPESVFRLLKAMSESQNGKRGYCVPDPLFIERAFERLDEGKLSTDEMAGLEFFFMDFLRRSERGLRNLEDQIARHPGFFVEFVELAYKRDDGKEDARERGEEDEAWRKRAKSAHGLIEALKRIPGRKESGEIDRDRLIKWVGDVRDGCRRSGRLRIGDDRIGTLLSKSLLKGKDGIWPAEPVRDALEEFYSEEISQGFQVGRRNAKNAHFGFGGGPERDSEREYREWANKIQYSHPRTSRILKELADHYSHLAKHYDDTAETIFRQLNL